MTGKINKLLEDLIGFFDKAKQGERNDIPLQTYKETVKEMEKVLVEFGEIDVLSKAEKTLRSLENIFLAWSSVGYQMSYVMAKKVLKNRLPSATFLNVNIPNLPKNEIGGVEITQQGMAIFREKFDKRIDPHKKTYYWLTGHKINLDQEPENADDVAILNNKISITPIRYDMTNYNFLNQLKTWDIKL